ncbi:MAG TPA: hypothetical protein VFN67_35835 [Polyangiales bacterium]|nr:hypothetical protein [Polyangiales bacterium]
MKQSLLVLGLSLAASSASASIPDANGVIHGCYNVFTGSTRIVDGTNCGLLDKPVTWSQKGPAGASVTGQSLGVGDAHCPAGGVALTLSGTTSYICNGVQGPQGPQGPAGDPDTLFGTGAVGIEPPPAGSTTTFLENKPFTAAQDGTCFLTVSGTQLDAMKGLSFRSVYRRDDGETHFLSQEALMLYHIYGEYADGYEDGHTNYPVATGTLTDAFAIEAGRTYRLGVNIYQREPNAPMSHGRPVGFRLNWICKYGLPSY